MSSRFVNFRSPVSAVPRNVVMCHMPIAGVATAGINVAAAAGEYVTAAAGVVYGLTNIIYLVTPRSLKHYCLHPKILKC